MTATYCLGCKAWAENGNHDCDCTDGHLPVFEWAWAYQCAEPGCTFTADTHHEAGQHWQTEGHTDYTPIRRVVDISETLDITDHVNRLNRTTRAGGGGQDGA